MYELNWVTCWRFKWTHLKEQLTYEHKVEQQRMRAEISQAKRQANFFAEQVEKGEQLRKLEEKVFIYCCGHFFFHFDCNSTDLW